MKTYELESVENQNLQLLVALEIIKQLKSRTNNAPDFDRISTLVEPINLEIFEQILHVFRSHFDIIRRNLTKVKFFPGFVQEAEQEFERVCGLEFYNLSSAIKVKCFSEIQNLEEDFAKVSPECLIKVTKNAVKILLGCRKSLIEQTIELKEKIISAQLAYSNLIKVEEERLDLKSIWNALIILSESKLKLKASQSFISLIAEMLDKVQKIYHNASQSFKILDRVEKRIQKKIENFSTLLYVISYSKNIDVNYQQFRLELWLGKGINHWGSMPISIEQLEQKIIENISDLPIKLLTI